MSYQGYSNTDWARSMATTLATHIRTVEESMMRNFQMGALLEAAGRINYNNGGRGFDWPVQYRLHNVEGNTGETERNFARRNLWKTASLPYRGYQATDAIYYKELKENQGEAAVVKVFNDFTGRLETSIKQAMGTEFYIDGTASGNEKKWHGFESMYGATQTVNITDGTARTANAADKVMYPNTTYAGLSTELGAANGENESGKVWPEGIADPEFDFWTPLIVNYTSSAFGDSTHTFAAQGDEAMRYAIIHSQRNTSMEGQVTNIWLARNLYMDLLNLQTSKEQINITSEHSLRALGFKNVLNFDGIEVSWEAGVPYGVGYGMNYNTVELKSMDDTLLRTEGPEYDIYTQAFNAVVSTLSNLKYASPRNTFKLIAAAQ